MNVRVLVGALAMAGATTVVAQAAGQWESPEQIWNASCNYCHGAGVARELRGLKIAPEAIAVIVRRGAPGMPAFHPSEMSKGELKRLSDWLSAADAPGNEQ